MIKLKKNKFLHNSLSTAHAINLFHQISNRYFHSALKLSLSLLTRPVVFDIIRKSSTSTFPTSGYGLRRRYYHVQSRNLSTTIANNSSVDWSLSSLATVVIIGGGIIGNSIAYHLSKLGRRFKEANTFPLQLTTKRPILPIQISRS